MKAVLLDRPGPPSSLHTGEIPTPRPQAGEALVRVLATNLNPVDYKVAVQGYAGWNYPHVLGVDVAGVVEMLGEGVNSWNPGERVFYHTTWRRDGSYAEFNVAPAHTFARIPDGISFVDAATLPCAGLTAYSALTVAFIFARGTLCSYTRPRGVWAALPFSWRKLPRPL
jgi:NADPH2:quinone reductase